mgnify:CR=1 FL=1
MFFFFVSGQLEQLVLEQTIDIVFLRGRDSPTNCSPLNNIFSRNLLGSDFKILESLQTSTTPSTTRSNSYCGVFVTPNLQKSWAATEPTKGDILGYLCQGQDF